MDKQRQELKERFEKNIYDYKSPGACEIEPLQGRDILELTTDECIKYGIFKIERRTSVSTYVGMEIEKDDTDYLYAFINEEWENVLSHTIYEWEKELDHGKEYEHLLKPLIPVIYVDKDYLFYFIENEEGILYFSTDKYNWFTYNIQPEKRPYHNRIEKLIKFKIPYIDRS